MERSSPSDQADIVTRRDFFGAGSIVFLSGTTGCLRLSDDDQQSEEPENETGDNDSESDQQDSSTKEGNGVGRFKQYTDEKLSYQVDYPVNWKVDASNEDYVQILNEDETVWIWIEIGEVRIDLELEVRNFRENFEPRSDVNIHADDSVTLSSGEAGHRFIIEMTDSETNPIFAHELIAQANGNQYWTSIIISRSIYDDDYAQLAEEILASVAVG
ncbi:hypothetical protein [Natronococcus jeotgali]|uniref:Lipoprotein n=1 Tax=Natronococcus jeotgali DSM 18795 TaxID=1227498 RepID=L9XLL4_9EURY|nr:hypothetical protein [Natronococcus jeotgali]ELY62630.1 hypothetical protein C492_07825 [Natronococcus jeotgali DSM 18795]